MEKLLQCYQLFFYLVLLCIGAMLGIYAVIYILVGLSYISGYIGEQYGNAWMWCFIWFLIVNGVFIPLIWLSGITEEL